MKAVLSNFVSLVTQNDREKNNEWKDILLKLGVIGVSVYFLVIIDMVVYGYLTR